MATFREFTDWLWQARGAPYVWWLEGEVSRYDGPPAWAVNGIVPNISEVKRGGFCVAVYNLACRYFGLTIPNPFEDEAWDGGVVSTWEYWYSSSVWYSDRQSAGFSDGDLLISPYSDASSQGHVAMICHYNGTPYVLEWIVNGGLVWNYTPDESNAWGDYQICVPVEVWGKGRVGGGENTGVVTPPPHKPITEYPGDCSDPKPLAHWMAHVAVKEFGLPKELPVMTVAVELTSALTSPGCLQDIPGFLPGTAQDYDSVGLFQQRPSQGWGTPEECSDPEHSLRKFCQEAAKLKDWEWNENTTHPTILGRWCQAVQNSGKPDAYRDKGYPIAERLLADYDASQPTPETGEQMHLAKHTFLAAGQPNVDFCNVAVTVLEAYGIDATAYNGDSAIEQAGREAKAEHNVIVVGKEAFTRLGESQERAGWHKDSVVWWTAQPNDAAALKFVVDWVLWWIANHSEDHLDEKLDLDYVQLLQALPKGEEYLKLLQDDPLPPPPEPPLTLEEKVDILWNEYEYNKGSE